MKKILIVALSMVLLSACVDNSGDTNGGANEVSVVDSEYPTKIVYKQGSDQTGQTQDCEERNGVFNECGDGCPPGSDICATVCVPVCELSRADEDVEPELEKIEAWDGVDETGLGLKVPSGFKIEEFVSDVPGARDLVGPDGLGNYWLSRTKQGVISLITIGDDGKVQSVDDILTGLNNPHGVALDGQDSFKLYVAEEDKVFAVDLYTEGNMETLVELPEGGRHFTRTVMVGPDDRLYVSIGSRCDVCEEEDERIGTVYVMDKDGSNFELYSEGLRNAMFMNTEPIFGDIWVTEMGRDHLGDDLPPDEVNVLRAGAHYGWPYCYGKKVYDEEFGLKSTEFCDDTVGSKIDLQAHSAPMGLVFIPEEGWPEGWGNDLLVAYHGSWNRTEPTGYKLMYFDLDDTENRELLGRQEFISGWLKDDGTVVGRPVDLLIQPGGTLFITDDYRGAVYRVTFI